MAPRVRHRAALAAIFAATAGLLTYRVLADVPAACRHRLQAVEGHLTELDQRVNALNVWGGEHWHRNGPTNHKPEFTPGDAYNRLADIAGDDDG